MSRFHVVGSAGNDGGTCYHGTKYADGTYDMEVVT